MDKKDTDIISQFRGMTDAEKLKLVDFILKQLDNPNADIEKAWAEEARKRWSAYKAIKLKALSLGQTSK
jgi:hypothetical protein